MTLHCLLRRGLLLGCACLAAQAQPTITRVINAGSLVPSFSPGSLAFIGGTNQIVSGSTTTVTVGSMAAAVLSSPDQRHERGADRRSAQRAASRECSGWTNYAHRHRRTSVGVDQHHPGRVYAPAFLMGGFYFLADATTGASIDFFNPATPGETLTVEAVGNFVEVVEPCMHFFDRCR